MIPLEALVWDRDRNRPAVDLEWMMVDPVPVKVMAGDDLELRIPLNSSAEEIGAVLIAYEVFTDQAGILETQGHFINEAVLETNSPQSIVEVLVNFDVHNSTGGNVTNFELDFFGLDFTCGNVTNAIGFVADTGEPWGANEDYPLVVRPIQGGTEVKWIQADRPLEHCEWLHVGLVFRISGLIEGINATVQGYWTVIGDTIPPVVKCVECENPHGKKIPPAGWSTLPGPKGGQNDDGFYRLLAKDNCDPNPQIFISGFGPFQSGDMVKITEAPGATPSIKKMGSAKGQAGAIAAHITLPADPVLTAVDASGNVVTCICCFVPPIPK
jgi:hypothetical protein